MQYDMKLFYHTCILISALLCHSANAQEPRFRVLTLSENGGHHIRYSEAAQRWLGQLAADSNFVIDHIHTTDSINAEYLGQYRLFIQLDYPPYNWKKEAAAAFTDYIEKGKGGWIGFHHATLLGEFDGFPMWEWFHRFMGSIRFRDYIADFVTGKVKVEDSLHPCMKGLPKEFVIEREEWYTYDKSPRPDVKVLASVDESTYQPSSSKKMGDHPVIWTNEKMKARNVYIFMGHSPDLFNNPFYTQLFRNAIFWAAGK